MISKNYTIRHMTAAEVSLAVEWAAREGWNPGLYDADCFFQTDPSGFLIGELDGKMIACKSAVKYGDDFGFMGFYMVAPEYRGKGYGYEIWKQGHDSLKGRVAGMDGVVEQQPNYRKSGYRLAYRNIRMEGKATGMRVENVHLIPASEVSFDSLVKYDRQYFPAERSKFLECWIQQPESHALTYVEKGSILGFGMIRKCRIGYKIGPLFSESENIANLISGALFGFPQEVEPVFLDIPEPNEAAHKLVERYKMKKVFETARMYHGKPPKVDLDHVFGVTTFELG
ncbi:MAG: GNAT family N-acetyltransferase [Bacteroidales bacterium]|nr:GNAT family N-acetyltransferase [Bacteroidales bacterium]